MWVWSKLSGIQWVDAWEERFYGNPNTVITHLKGGKSLRVEVYCTSEAEAEAIREEFGGAVRRMKKDGWVKQQVGRQAPLKIRNRLVITQDDRPAVRRQLERQFPGRVVVSIPAEMAFGTGDHPTTEACLRFLTDEAAYREGTVWRLLDMGCGSGVLALSARLLGADACEAMDYDPKAVEVAEGNLARNGVDGVEVREGDVLKWRSRRKFDVVVANLFAGVLEAAFPRLAGAVRKGGRLIISGILREQWDGVRRAAETAGMEVMESKRKGKWVSALLRGKGDL
jgi:ribosomal protein L11 methyltransferase